mgnify:CR=1 FL=1
MIQEFGYGFKNALLCVNLRHLFHESLRSTVKFLLIPTKNYRG